MPATSRLVRVHVYLGLLCALPLFGWTSSGLLSAWPRAATAGVTYEKVQLERLKVGPQKAAQKARELGAEPASSLTLQQADGHLAWQVVGGGRAVHVDAETGVASWAEPAGWTSRYFTQAHFLWFTGPWRQPLLIGCMGAILALLATGLTLAAVRWVALHPADANSSRGKRL